MSIVYRPRDVEFEWDENKARGNLEKHAVTFEEAAEVFFDPFYQFGDATPENIYNGEKRQFIIDYSLEPRLLLVVYLENGVRT
jgi:uncharacterized DUF497 family protein